MKVAVIGAGPAGLAAAIGVSRSGSTAVVFEAATEVGGLARSVDVWDVRLDLGAHIFESPDEETAGLWSTYASPSRVVTVSRGIHVGAAIVPYPPRPLPLARHLGISGSLRAVAGVLAGVASRRRRAAMSAEDVVVARFGRELYTRFFRGYLDKLYGIPGDSVDRSFADALFASSRSAGRGGTAAFDYPVGGLGEVWRRMARAVTDSGGEIRLGVRVDRLVGDSTTVRGVSIAGTDERFDAVISTLPLSALARLLPDAPPQLARAASDLRSRSTVLVLLRVPKQRLFDQLWLYLYSADVRAGRVTNFDRLVEPEGGRCSYLGVEYWCDHSDTTWRMSDGDMVQLAASELESSGILQAGSRVDGHVERLAGSHPVLSITSVNAVRVIREHVATMSGLASGGRHGAHNLGGMGQSMADALDASRLAVSTRR